jgi:hypothetical protein
MNALERTIVTDWEDNKTPIDVIAQEMDLEPESVKAVLCQYSSVYRNSTQGAPVENSKQAEQLNDSELQELMSSYRALTFSDNEHIRERVLRRLIDEKKGRLDKKTPSQKAIGTIRNVQINVLQLNETLREQRKKKLLGDIGNIMNAEVVG